MAGRTISVSTISDGDGGITRLSEIPLEPGQQKAAFLFQDPRASQKFRGSVILSGNDGSIFAVVAPMVNQNLLSVIPVLPQPAPPAP